MKKTKEYQLTPDYKREELAEYYSENEDIEYLISFFRDHKRDQLDQMSDTEIEQIYKDTIIKDEQWD